LKLWRQQKTESRLKARLRYPKKPNIGEMTMKELSEKRLCKEAVEVEAELEYCYSRIICHDVDDIKKRIEKGEAEVMSDPSLKRETIDLNKVKLLLHDEKWECMLNEAERATKSIPRAERRLLSVIEEPQYQGAICALHWLLKHHDEDLVAYLTSDRFKALIELEVQSGASDNDVDE